MRRFLTGGRKLRYAHPELFDAGNLDEENNLLDPESARAHANRVCAPSLLTRLCPSILPILRSCEPPFCGLVSVCGRLEDWVGWVKEAERPQAENWEKRADTNRETVSSTPTQPSTPAAPPTPSSAP